ncbi:hypothetical protein ACHAPT_010742 [Fusarium lateritium]
MADTTPVVIVLLLTLATTGYLFLKSDNGGTRPLKVPIIGDLHYSPMDKPLINWWDWANKNGPIVTPKLFGIFPIVVINTSEAVNELFSKRSQWYSSRPPSARIEMVTGASPGKSKFTVMHDYDTELQLYHRILSPSIGALATPQYQPLMELESLQLLVDLVDLSKRSRDNIASTTSIYPVLERTQFSIMMSLHYGMRITTFKEPILHQVMGIHDQLTHLLGHPGLPGWLPAIRYLPALVSPWKRHANKLLDKQTKLYMKLMNHGKNSEGWNATKQVIAAVEKQARTSPISELDLAFILATSLQGGMDTTPRQILWLFAGLLQNPAFLEQSHAVLDKVVGHDRLPNFQDRPKLVLIDAVVHELLRWRPIVPGGIPRRVDKDDEYKGIKIGKGTTIMANGWSIGRDEAVFDPSLGDLDDYIPERWLIHDENNGQAKLRRDLPLPVFGQGRRTCLGKKAAIDGAFLQAARLLWAFDVEPVGEVDPWKMEAVGLVIMPTEFRFKLKPRKASTETTIEREWNKANKNEVLTMDGQKEG